MTIRMELGIGGNLRRLHTLPEVRNKARCVQGLTDNKVSATTDMLDFDGVNLEYTSLRDLIASPKARGRSPKAGEFDWCNLSQVTFKDRLVKQAARAYLQPMATESTQQTPFLERCWTSLTNEGSLVSSVKDYVQVPIQSCIEFIANNLRSKLSQVFGILAEGFRPHWFKLLCGSARS